MEINKKCYYKARKRKDANEYRQEYYLSAMSDIYFDYKEYFCGATYIYLQAFKEKGFFGWSPYSIGIALHDHDDLDIALIYQANEDNFIDILQELLNWMCDHEQGISSYEKIWEPLDFFPDLGCERRRW